MVDRNMSIDEYDDEDIPSFEDEDEDEDELDEFSEEELEDWESYVENITKDG